MDLCELKATLICIQQVPGQPGVYNEALSQRERQKKMAGREKGKEGGSTLRPHTEVTSNLSFSSSSVSSYSLCASGMDRSPGILHNGLGNVSTYLGCHNLVRDRGHHK